MTIQEFRVLVAFAAHDECSIYEAWKSATFVPLPTAYRVAWKMAKLGWLEHVRDEASSTNSIPRTIFRITDGGKAVAEHMAATIRDDVIRWEQAKGARHE